MAEPQGGNGNVLSYRVSRIEHEAERRDLRIDDLEEELVAVRIQMARWAAGGGLFGGAASAILIELVKALASQSP